MFLELRNAVRALLRAPLFLFAAVSCIALGVGATAAISSAIDRALLQPLPFRNPDRLVTVYRTTPHFDTGPFAAPNYADLGRMSGQLEELVAVATASALLTLPDDAMRLATLRATGNVFRALGAQPLLGRVFGTEDDAPEAPPVVVVGEELWRERFGADPALIGRAITLDGLSRTVIGILPRDFRLPHGGRVLRAEAWVPMQFSANELGQRRSNFLMAMGRLAPGATVESANAELVRLFEGIVEANPQLRGEQVRVVPLQAESVRSVRTPLLLLFGAVVLVLLIAATNVASLLLARGVQRQRELAIRAALGGGRWTVVRPVLTETAVIMGLGLVFGLVLAWVGVRTIGTLAAERIPQLAGLGIDGRVIAFGVVLAIVVGALCAVVPAWRGAAVDPQDALRGGRGALGSRAQHRALGTLVVVEVALSLMLLIGAGLVLQGFAGLLRNDPGFDPTPILTVRATASAADYPDNTVVPRFLEPALAEIRRIPGVREAAAISLLPYETWGWNFNVRYEGHPADDPTQRPLIENRVVTPEFFEVTGQRLLAGRLLRDSDDLRAGAPAVVVANEALVRRDFPNEDPIGKRFHRTDTIFATIVGVVSDIRNTGPLQEPQPEIYWHFRQSGGWTAFPIVVRVERGDPAAIAGAVRAAIRGVDPKVAVTHVRTMSEVIGASLGRQRFYVTLLGVFAGVAVVLAVSGIYGVMSYAVAQRTRELGIRTALGSTWARTLRLVTMQGAVLVGVGIALGLAGGAAATRLLASMLYGVSPLDAATWAMATAALAAVGVLGTLLPAWRATRVDPLVAMRAE
ncbi:MAG TPA: ABC transporter permease [Gemmatimonadaceae bacterium]|nr:ABC transporter permease [Gemmatimonadaceae bacterium]